jgi:hypothetical protein
MYELRPNMQVVGKQLDLFEGLKKSRDHFLINNKLRGRIPVQMNTPSVQFFANHSKKNSS